MRRSALIVVAMAVGVLPAASQTGGIPAVLIAALIVRSLPLNWVRWLVVVVVVYTAVSLLRSAAASRPVASV